MTRDKYKHPPGRVWITWDDAYPWEFERPDATEYMLVIKTGGFTCVCCGRNMELRIDGKFCNECAGYRSAVTSDSARRAAEWKDEGGHAWEIRQNVDCVECPHCCFTFAAAHTDGYSNGYSCPNCKGCPDAAAPPDNDAESLLSKVTTIADIGSAEEFGDALERLKSIRELVDTATKQDR